jgi:hypothetical protein
MMRKVSKTDNKLMQTDRILATNSDVFTAKTDSKKFEKLTKKPCKTTDY